MLSRGRPLWRRVAAAGAVAMVACACLVAAAARPAGADTVRNQQRWVLDAVHAPAAWQTTQGRGAIVAVIDSGVDPNVSDLLGSVIGGRDFTGIRTPMSNPNWGVHGTWMASLIAGHGHAGGSGVLGVAPEAKVLSVRVLADRGDPGYRRLQREDGDVAQDALAKAIIYATARHADVISMSLGNGAPSRPVRLAIQRAVDRGVVVVASSGNSGNSRAARRQRHAPYLFPADYPGVLGVGAVTSSGQPAGFSSANLSVAVAAPGFQVPAQGRDGQYWLVSGTSPACALTAGVAALVKARYPRLAPGLVLEAITASASNAGTYDDHVGFGVVNAAAALAVASRLAAFRTTSHRVAATARFGGGPGAVPGVPVAPRGKQALALFSLLALVSLAAVGMLGARLARTRRRAAIPAPAAGTGPDPWPEAGP